MGKITKSIEVDAPVSACYDIWSDFNRFPEFMENIVSIRQKGDPGVWHWEVKGPLGKTVEWDAQVDSMQPNQAVSWHSVRNANVDNSGAVTFEELANNRTRINVVMVYDPPAGALGEFVADIFQNPEKMVEEDLNNFRRLVESEVTQRGTGMGKSVGVAAPMGTATGMETDVPRTTMAGGMGQPEAGTLDPAYGQQVSPKTPESGLSGQTGTIPHGQPGHIHNETCGCGVMSDEGVMDKPITDTHGLPPGAMSEDI